MPGAQIDVALSMQAKQVAILPTIETITLFNPAPSVVQTPKTSIVEVIFDIFCSTLHNAETLRKIRDILFDQFPRFKQIFDELVDAVGKKEAALVVLRAEELMHIMFGNEMLSFLESRIGAEAIEEILAVLASQFVPLIGWGWWAISFLYAIKQNWAEIKPLL